MSEEGKWLGELLIFMAFLSKWLKTSYASNFHTIGEPTVQDVLAQLEDDPEDLALDSINIGTFTTE